MDLNGKRILITGGATGIGRATAKRCSAEGAKVVVADINPVEGEQCVEGLRSAGGEAWYVKVDVSTESDVEAMAANAERLMGGIDGMVSAAGIAKDSLVPIDELTTENWERTIAVNLSGSYLAAKHVVPVIRKAGGGVIVMIASGAGVSEASSMVAYGASKGGVNGLGMTLARHLERDRIRVNVVCPGNVDTPLKVDIIEQQVEAIGENARRDYQLAGLVDPGGIASIITFLLSSDADLLTGAVFTR
jgi:NAD(P)-dependent dehydrogenase (short-subunit alcohol dehydrogenase family)